MACMGEGDARFHIEHAGAEETAIFNFARHVGNVPSG